MEVQNKTYSVQVMKVPATPDQQGSEFASSTHVLTGDNIDKSI